MSKVSEGARRRAAGAKARLGRLAARARRLGVALARDAAGNTLAIMAAILIPLAAFSGSAIDMARLYVVKVRLQQACDAGVLAGRKFMTDSSPNTPLDSTATAQANTFFKNNFKTGWFTTNTVQFTPTKTSDSQVAGTASTTVPMTIMKMFAVQPVVLNVNCEARYDVADTDIMFVLDTTASMSCLPTDSTTCSTTAQQYTRPWDGVTDYYSPEKSGSKLQAVRDAVSDFYTTMVANSDPSTHIRYGFVTYSSSVNAGAAVYALSPSYFVSQWKYQTRIVTADYTIPNSTTTTINNNAKSQAACDALDTRTPATPLTYDPSTGQAILVNGTWTRSLLGTYYCSVATSKLGPTWTYAAQDGSTYPAYDVTKYLATINSGTTDDPTKVDGSTSKWQGCIEMNTTSGNSDVSNYDITNLPADLDPDVTPTGNNRYAPMWPDVEYGRNWNSSYGFTSTAKVTTNGDTTDQSSNNSLQNMGGAGYMMKQGFQSCGAPVSRLQTMTQSQVQNYVAALRPHGGTYHDTGMIWGTRMISPNGIFKQDTQAWAGRQEPNRVIVFLTDGQMAPNSSIYGQYGIEYFDRRVAAGDNNNLDDYHNARFLAECAKAKSENIDVWVVAVGQSVTDPLKACATTADQALYAGTGADLSNAFKKIAKQVAMLRISK